MTALLEFKQKIKHFFGVNEVYILPFLKFAIALLYFMWINENMGYMPDLDNNALIAIIAVICAILPAPVTVLAGIVLMLLHAYALGLEAAGFLLVLILILAVFFLRFTAGTSYIMVLSPLSFSYGFPVMLPIGAGLLMSAASAVPAACSVILYYFIRYINIHSSELSNADIEPVAKLQMMTDGIVLNWGMWITVVAFVLVILLVNLIRTRAFDYAWRVAIIMGGAVYVLVMLMGSYYLSATVDTNYLIVSTVIALLIGLILEFFVFGGDYSRAERLEYEDDEYYYYVKAVPKAVVPRKKRRIKKIDVDSEEERERRRDIYEEAIYGNPGFTESDQAEALDLEKKLEESLREL